MLVGLSSLPKKVALIYLIFSLLWIFGSDWVVYQFSIEYQHHLQTIKGWVFVVATSLLIYILLLRPCVIASDLQNELTATAASLEQSNQSKSALLSSIPISLWEEDFSDVKRYIDEHLPKTGLDIRIWLEKFPAEVGMLASKVRIISVGGSTLEMFGAVSEHDLRTNLNIILGENALPAFREEIISLYNGEKTFHVEAQQRKLDGVPIMTSTTVAIAPGYEQSWSRIIVAIEDVSDRVNAVKAVNGFFEQPMNLNLVAKLDGTVLRVNAGWENFLGYQQDELEGTEFLELVHPDDIEKTMAEVESLSTGKNTLYFCNRYKHKNGEYHHLMWSAVCSVTDGLIYAVATDITSNVSAEQKLRDAASVYKSTTEGIFITELDGSIRDVNNAFTTITGYSLDEVKGENASLLNSGRHDRSFYQAMWVAIESTGNWQGEIWNRKKDGRIYPEFLTISVVKDDEGITTGYVGAFSDISNIKQTESQLAHLSTHDSLTELPNRSLLDERLKHAIKHADREGQQIAVVMLDVDNFKHLNDSFGFAAGDNLLKQLAIRIVHTVRADDTVARISADEFAVILEGIDESSQIVFFVEKLLAVLAEPFTINDEVIQITTSAGVSLYPDDGSSYDVLTRNADAALTQAKRSGSNSYKFYTEDLTAAAYESLFIESALRSALEKEEFYVVYQPQVSFETGKLSGLEALLRWKHSEHGLIPPSKFIPIAERSGLIKSIGEWVLRSACQQGKQWLDQGYQTGRIAVNVAGPQIASGDLAEVVKNILAETGLPEKHLELEVTESFVMDRTEDAVSLLSELREMGIQIAIDDFGTGYSSLSYLKKLPIDKLKIDQSFVAEIQHSGDDLAIAEAVIALSQALNLVSIAEGVETEEQAALLRAKGCIQAQGYLYSRPVEAKELERTFLHGDV